MKKSLIVLPFVSFLVLVIASFGYSMMEKKQVNHIVPKGFAVVELFTSEGCSSCPPADAAVAALAKDYPVNVFVLGFHVDYWNYLGWKDEFSEAGFTNRQQAYAAAFQLNSIYTPQAVVNGKIQFTGSEKSRLYSSVEKELEAAGATTIELSAKAGSKNDITVNYTTGASNKSMVCIALVQLHAASPVKRGENKGLLLQHVDVVRNFKTMTSPAGVASLGLPDGLTAKDCKVVAFVQNRNDLHISGATEATIQ